MSDELVWARNKKTGKFDFYPKSKCRKVIKKADLVFTDPPYGMGKDFENDALDNQEDFNELWMGVYNSLFKCPILIWYKPAAIDEIIVPARAIGLKLIDYFHLYKPNDIAFPRQSWIRISESMMLFSKSDIEYNEIKPYAHDTYIWNHTTKDKSFYHPSVKPIEVVVDVISRIRADIIADFFLGSGTTLIASQSLGRICYASEIEPKYIDIAIIRWINWMLKNNKESGIKILRNGKEFDYKLFLKSSKVVSEPIKKIISITNK